MDRSWIQLRNRFCPEYKVGVDDFMAHARSTVEGFNRIRCPCVKCMNVYFKDLNEVEDHLYINGMLRSYTRWVHHGEQFDRVRIESDDHRHNDQWPRNETNYDDDVQNIIHDVHIASTIIDGAQEAFNSETTSSSQPLTCGSTSGGDKFSRLLSDGQSELYPGCREFSKLSFLINLLHVKTMCNWSNKSLDLLLPLLKRALPPGGTLPESFYETKSIMRDLGLDYVKIDSCKRDCILFWKEYENEEKCPKCGESRYKYNQGKHKKVPQKVLRYFPLKPRLQRLFVSRQVAEDMRWHSNSHVNGEEVLKHPADSEAWRDFDREHEWFARDPRNVRLGLASDGFNPFGNMSNSYSMWPVILMPYNLPPWKCMKDPFFMLSLLIPGPKSPGNDIDVYLRPLIDELKELWENGVETYDAFTGEVFVLHAAILWTINDFPAYANLSGWSTKGKLACPTCNSETCSQTLKNGRKQCYMGHRRFLSMDHHWRRSYKFDGKQERRGPPTELSGDDILEQIQELPYMSFGKTTSTRKRKRSTNELNWKKKSIFFELPYWKKLKLRHNLDVMHIEKNICESIFGTLMNIEGKTKDSVKARLDMQEMNIRQELHLRKDGDSIVMDPGLYTMSEKEQKSFCEWLKNVKFPDGYASNISRCVNVENRKISGMKSHDCHVMMQRLLPVALRGYLSTNVSNPIIELGLFFKDLCSKSLKIEMLKRLEKDIVVILCKLEMIFPPAFFDIMVHLAIHLPREAMLCGPVHYRWMYPIERFLRKLKSFVRNKARPEGSIAEAYINNECLTFCSMYLNQIETRFNQPERNYDGNQEQYKDKLSVFAQDVRPLGGKHMDTLNLVDYNKIRWYVLNNCDEINDYLIEHRELLEMQGVVNVQQEHELYFAKWFEQKVKVLVNQKCIKVADDLYSLACGPHQNIIYYSGCFINGMRFHTERLQRNRATQNSGVVVKGEHEGVDIDYYGVLTDIIELKYLRGNHVYLFKCKWWDVSNKKLGIKTDEWFTSVNTSRTWYSSDPFVLASQVEQVFYVDDTKLGTGWRVVQKIVNRNVFDISEDVSEEDNSSDANFYEFEAYQQLESAEAFRNVQVDESEVGRLTRDDIAPYHVPPEEFSMISLEGSDEDVDFICVDPEEDEDVDETLHEYCSEEEEAIFSEFDNE